MSFRILLVADDASVQHMVRESFEPFHRDLEVSISRGQADAVSKMDGAPFDALVTDSRLGGTDCIELLTEARRRQPQATRIALSDPGDAITLVRLGSLAHRVLSKPCDPDELRGAVQRARSLRELLTTPSLAVVVGRLGSIPTLSTLYTRIADELNFPDYSLAAVGNLVAQDIGIAAKLLQMANSALIGLRKPATTPLQAVRVLGAELTRTLVLAADLFSRYNPASLRPFSIEALWDHSRAVAELAGEIATIERAGDRVIREAALAGLLHDIGKLTLASQLPGPYREILSLIRSAGLTAAEAERRVLGASHAEIGAYLLGLWGLPDAIVEAVAWHHRPAECPGNTFTALTVVHAADAIIRAPDGVMPDLPYLQRLNLAERFEVWQRLPTTRTKAE
jgi:putative nucleotidyltransferase with HDIG domain